MWCVLFLFHTMSLAWNPILYWLDLLILKYSWNGLHLLLKCQYDLFSIIDCIWLTIVCCITLIKQWIGCWKARCRTFHIREKSTSNCNRYFSVLFCYHLFSKYKLLYSIFIKYDVSYSIEIHFLNFRRTSSKKEKKKGTQSVEMLLTFNARSQDQISPQVSQINFNNIFIYTKN